MHVLRSNCAQLANGRAFGALAAAIRSLFANNEKGVWYDPSDFSTMFQDAAGTTPVTAVGQPVGRILDKSGRGNHATQATATSRPTLQQDSGGRYYLLFDGVDDWLQTVSIDFTSTDKMTVVAGVRKLSSSIQSVVELSNVVNSSNGSFAILANTSTNTTVLRYRAIGTPSVFGDVSHSLADSVSAVLTGSLDFSQITQSLRLNGGSVATSSTNTGVDNFGNYPLYIGRRGGSLLPFNGRIYSLIVRGAQSSQSQIEASESYVNKKTGAY